MNRWTVVIATLLLAALFAIGCSGSGGNNPLAPNSGSDLSLTGRDSNTVSTNNDTYLWGYYKITIDPETKTAEVVANRTAQFAANCVTFLNGNPPKLVFNINETPIGPDYIDVDIDVGLVHPFAGLTQYNGYDVRGVFIGDGSATLNYDSALLYGVQDVDQTMFPDPVGGNGGPDGYTRWFNPTEFTIPGVLGFTDGSFASLNYTGTGTLNPYKYFADNLGANDDEWDFLVNTADNGVFSAGTTNFRNYYLRFPNAKGINYDYVVLASWKGELPEDHPANAPEPVAITVTQTDNMYDEDGNIGGNLILDIDVFSWAAQPSTITLESSVLSSNLDIDCATEGLTGGDHYSTYHVDVPADALSQLEGNTVWVIAQCSAFTYGNEYGVPNSAESSTLAAFFNFPLHVLDTAPVTNGLAQIQTGDLPTPLPFTTEKDFSVVGDNTLGYAGVYYFGDNYTIYRYALDYSAPAATYMALQGNYGYMMNQWLGTTQNPARLEIDGSGGVICTSNGTAPFFAGYLQNKCMSWWSASNPIAQNALTLSSAYGDCTTRDVTSAFSFFQRLYGFWSTNAVYIPPINLIHNGLDAPYTSGSYTGWSINAGPLDTSGGGSQDGSVSDKEAYRQAIDYNPQGVSSPYDCIFYYMEGAPDQPTIEGVYNQKNGGANPSYLSAVTIDETNFAGTPKDITVLNEFGVDPAATGNWLAVLEDNGDNTWQVELFAQDGTFIAASNTFPGTAMNIDTDHAAPNLHVWFDNGGTLKYSILEWTF